MVTAPKLVSSTFCVWPKKAELQRTPASTPARLLAGYRYQRTTTQALHTIHHSSSEQPASKESYRH